MRADKDALGFIPGGKGSGIDKLVQSGRLLITTHPPFDLESRAMAYIAFTLTHKLDCLTIHQTCVDDQYRHIGIGSALVNAVQALYPSSPMKACVGLDLPAVEFWLKIGFTLLRRFTHKTSGRTIGEFHKPSFLERTKHERDPIHQENAVPDKASEPPPSPKNADTEESKGRLDP